jgi:alpha-tubulin suppressor-like RCC1 family protein
LLKLTYCNTFYLIDEGSVYASGEGFSETGNPFMLVFEPNDQEAKATSASCGTRHGLVLLSGGGVLAFGTNDMGQLGLKETSQVLRPILMPPSIFKDERIAEVACGANHSAFVTGKRNSNSLKF